MRLKHIKGMRLISKECRKIRKRFRKVDVEIEIIEARPIVATRLVFVATLIYDIYHIHSSIGSNASPAKPSKLAWCV